MNLSYHYTRRQFFLNLGILASQALPSRGLTHISDDTDQLNSAFSDGGDIKIPNRTLIVSGPLHIPPSATVEFAPSSRIVLTGGGTIVWDGGISAPAHQQIFGGNLVKSPFQRIGDEPYEFSIKGTPLIDWSSPYWFGAAGDGSRDDIIPLTCAQYFGGKQFLPAGLYAVSHALHLRRSGQHLTGEGEKSIIKASRDNLGQIVALRGELPITSEGPPSRYLSDVTVSDILIDGSDATNTNGVGLSCSSMCALRRITMQNIGRKAVTLQYWCKDNVVEDIFINDALQEINGNTAAISIEGQSGGINFALDGGVAHSIDAQGWDCTGNIFKNVTILRSTYRYILISRARNNLFTSIRLGISPATRSDLFFGPSSENNVIEGIQRDGNITACAPIFTNKVLPSSGTTFSLTPC